MKILITGCAGFIGANFTNYWLDTYPNDTVVGVDALTYAANLEALDALKRRSAFTFYHANICDRKAMQAIFLKEAPELVVNFAAETHVDRSIDGAGIFVETNVLGTQVLLDMCLAYGKTRFHQISTDEVYGDLALDSPLRFDETAPLSPSSPYSASKAAADLLVLSYYKTHGLPVSISRCSNNYGIYQHEEKLIPKVILCAIRQQAIPLYGDGSYMRDWIYVLDHCRAVDKILHHALPGSIYNIGGNQLLSNLSLVEAILHTMQTRTPIAFVTDRKGHDRKYALNTEKIEQELGFFPEIPFLQGLEQTVQYYKKT